MDKILNLDNVDQYNQLYGIETLHPLVSVVNLNEATRGVDFIRMNYGVYAIFLKLEKSYDIKYGRPKYDYEEGTIVCFAPEQKVETTSTITTVRTNVYGILFHPDILRGTSLNKTIKNYTFFSYEVNEALHVSEEEQTIMLNCLNIIQNELKHNIDKHSKKLIVIYIELLLGDFTRFYERQFITRDYKNKIILEKMEKIIDNYISSGKLCNGILPAPEKQFEAAKKMLLKSGNTSAIVAQKLGYPNVQYFSFLFKKITGISPNKYKQSHNEIVN